MASTKSLSTEKLSSSPSSSSTHKQPPQLSFSHHADSRDDARDDTRDLAPSSASGQTSSYDLLANRNAASPPTMSKSSASLEAADAKTDKLSTDKPSKDKPSKSKDALPPSPPATIHLRTRPKSRKWGARLSSFIPMLTSSISSLSASSASSSSASSSSSSSDHSLASDSKRKSAPPLTLESRLPAETLPMSLHPHPPPRHNDTKHSSLFHPFDTPAATDPDCPSSPPPPSYLSTDFILDTTAVTLSTPAPASTPTPAPAPAPTTPAPDVELSKTATTPILRTTIPDSPLVMDQDAQMISSITEVPQFPFLHDDQPTPLSEPQFPFLHQEASLSEPQFPFLQQEHATPLIKTPRHASPDLGATDLRGPHKLRKNSVGPKRARASSYQAPPPLVPVPGIKTSTTLPVQGGRRSVSSQPFLSVKDSTAAPTMLSPVSRPHSRNSSRKSASPARGRVRRSWMPGSRSRSNSCDVSSPNPQMQAWIMTEETISEYNTSLLKNAEKIPELWNENGNVLVYLYPRGSSSGPSFKVPEFTISSSYLFNELLATEPAYAHGQNRPQSYFGGRSNLDMHDASRMQSPPPENDYSGELRLHLPVARPSASTHLVAPSQSGDDEMHRLIAIRNLFAFLTGQPLVGTKSRPTVFAAFLEIAELLEEFAFAAMDGSGFGAAVDMSFGFYCDHLGISDCRHSREKTVQALILGERMRNTNLYNEAFAHAAGKYSGILNLRLSIFDKISPQTRQRLERAHIDLINRQQNVNDHLEQFEFPSIFAGIANSTSSAELRLVRFKVWRNSFARMRSFMLSYYKSAFGSWPPKASSKKNPFMESGLNRLVLKLLYSDMCALYDLLVDRTDLTTRVIDHLAELSSDPENMTRSAIRNIESEYDRSRPPVLPPIPFDLPQLPCVSSIHKSYVGMSAKQQAKFDRKLKENDLMLILSKAYNPDTSSVRLPFLDQFKEFEAREAKGKIKQDLVDQRIGYWIFLYAVLQSLPMLVIDAPGLQYTEGTEYFLCQPPIGQPPWAEDGQVRKMWYEVAGGGGLVELSADAVMYSVEGTYHRSHCWLAAKQWEGMEEANTPIPDTVMSPLAPPPAIFQGGSGIPGSPTSPVSGPATPLSPLGTPPLVARSRNASPSRVRATSAYRSSIAIGLEPVPMEPPTSVFGVHQRSSSLGPRPRSAYFGNRKMSTSNLVGMGTPRGGTPRTMTPSTMGTSGTTFDDILGGVKDDANKENKEESKGKENQREKLKAKKPLSKKKGFFF